MEDEKKENKFKEIELRSEEVQEVMNKISPWILRSGITVLCCIVLALLVGSYLFKYPDTLTAEITLSTEAPPAYVLARASGKVDCLLVENGQAVVQGENLGVIENSSLAVDVLQLKETLEGWWKADHSITEGETLFADKHWQLGELQSSYAAFYTALTDYARFVNQNYYEQKLASEEEQLKKQLAYARLAHSQYRLLEQEHVLAYRMYERDSILFRRNVMIAAEFEESGSRYLQKLQAKESSRMSITQIAIQIEQGKESLLDLRRQALNESQQYELAVRNSAEQLAAQLMAWEKQYVLKSPISGKVTFMTVWSPNQNVAVDETVMVVAPDRETPPVGKALLPLQGSGKVKVGQSVNVRLNNYPDQEFGYVRGQVSSVSPVPTAEGMYVVEVFLPQGLHTNYGKTLPITRDMKGTADIITADLRLIERLFMPLRKIFQNQ